MRSLRPIILVTTIFCSLQVAEAPPTDADVVKAGILLPLREWILHLPSDDPLVLELPNVENQLRYLFSADKLTRQCDIALSFIRHVWSERQRDPGARLNSLIKQYLDDEPEPLGKNESRADPRV